MYLEKAAVSDIQLRQSRTYRGLDSTRYFLMSLNSFEVTNDLKTPSLTFCSISTESILKNVGF